MKTIKIPKVPENLFYPVKIIKSKTTPYELCLCKQVIEGLEIPKDSVIRYQWNSTESNFTGDVLNVPGIYINRLLRFVYLENLRNNK